MARDFIVGYDEGGQFGAYVVDDWGNYERVIHSSTLVHLLELCREQTDLGRPIAISDEAVERIYAWMTRDRVVLQYVEELWAAPIKWSEIGP